MESAGLVFSRIIESQKIKKPDLVLATNLMDLTHFKSLSRWHDIPYILYVHENQLDYPLGPGEKMDFHYVWKDYMNYLIADKLIFNSKYNLESFLEKFRGFTSRLPDCKPDEPSLSFRSKAEIIPPGCTLINKSDRQGSENKSEDSSDSESEEQGIPVILWNQRWEHDKNPDDFFDFLGQLKERKIQFKLVVLGESFKDSPDCFSRAEDRFKEEMIHFGYAENRGDYESWLQKSDYVISTALQENFGISVVEAISAGAIPLLPNRLAYPEVLDKSLHPFCLYNGTENRMETFLALLALYPEDRKRLRNELRESVQPYSWTHIALRFDALFDFYSIKK